MGIELSRDIGDGRDSGFGINWKHIRNEKSQSRTSEQFRRGMKKRRKKFRISRE